MEHFKDHNLASFILLTLRGLVITLVSLNEVQRKPVLVTYKEYVAIGASLSEPKFFAVSNLDSCSNHMLDASVGVNSGLD